MMGNCSTLSVAKALIVDRGPTTQQENVTHGAGSHARSKGARNMREMPSRVTRSVMLKAPVM